MEVILVWFYYDEFFFSNSNERNFIEAMSPGEVDPERSIHEMLDLGIIYYYAIAHKHVVKVSRVFCN